MRDPAAGHNHDGRWFLSLIMGIKMVGLGDKHLPSLDNNQYDSVVRKATVSLAETDPACLSMASTIRITGGDQQPSQLTLKPARHSHCVFP